MTAKHKTVIQFPEDEKTVSIHDESTLTGTASSVSFPASAREVAEIIRTCKELSIPVTVRGGLTGLSGAALPSKGHCLSTEKLTAVQYDADSQTVWAEAGASFQFIAHTILRESRGSRELPVMPSEESATIGGAFALGIDCPRSFGYGSLLSCVESLTWCDHLGELHTNSASSDPELLQHLFRSEGMYGIFTGFRLHTTPVQESIWGILFFFTTTEDAVLFAGEAAGLSSCTVIEYLDQSCFAVIDACREKLPSLSSIPAFPDGQIAAILIELENADPSLLEEHAFYLLERSELHNSNPDLSWTVSGNDVQKLRRIRHAVIECINTSVREQNLICGEIRHLCLTVSLPSADLLRVLTDFKTRIKNSGLSCVLFGSAGENRLTISVLSDNDAAYHSGISLLEELCLYTREMGGSVFSAFGVGKQYRELFCSVISEAELRERIRLKQQFDAKVQLNPDNLLSDALYRKYFRSGHQG